MGAVVLVTLALLMTLHVASIDFNFRWMALLAILCLRAAISLIVFLVRRNKASASVPQRTSKMVLNVVGSILVIAVAAMPALVFPSYEGLPSSCLLLGRHPRKHRHR